MEKKKAKGSKTSGRSGKGNKSLHEKKEREKKEVSLAEPDRVAIIKEEAAEKNNTEIMGSLAEILPEQETTTRKDEVRIDDARTGEKKIDSEGVQEERGKAIGAEADEVAVSEEGQEELLSFFLEDEEYAIDIMIIKEIIGMIDVTFVPRADEYIRGIVSLRGAIIPVFDLRRKLGLKETQLSDMNRIIVISIDDEMIGLAVDSVAEVVKIRGLDIEPTPFTISGIDAEYIRGIIRHKGRIVILLDIVRLLKLQEGKSLR